MSNNRLKNKAAGIGASLLITSVVVFVLLPVLLLFTIEQLFVVQTGWISYEMLAMSLLVLWLSSGIVASIYLLLLFLQVLFAVGPAYHLSFASAAGWVGSVFQLPASTQLIALLIVLTFFLSGFFAARRMIDKQNSKLLLSTLVCFFLLAGFVVDRFVEPLVGRNLVTSNTLSLYQVARNEYSADARIAKEDAQEYIASGSNVLFSSLKENRPLPSKILLVVVESLGFGNESTQTLQYKDIVDQSVDLNRYSVEYGQVNFRGSTVPGEIRELCQLRTSNVIVRIEQNRSENCLPILFKKAGYTTSAYHGYSGGFFDRFRLYRELGFDDRLFANTLLTKFKFSRRCGFLIFKGLCDADIAQQIKIQLGENKHTEFVYWLTLNGHQPVSASPTVGEYVDCEQMQMSPGSLCWTIQHAQVVSNSVVDIANSVSDIGIIMVGDHSPGGTNGGMSADDVPVITIFPKKLK